MHVPTVPTALEYELADRFATTFASDGQPIVTGVRAEIGSSVIVVITRHALGEGETALVQKGGVRGLNELRTELRMSLATELTRIVEQTADVKVLAYLTACQAEADVTVDSFVLALPDEAEPSRR